MADRHIQISMRATSCASAARRDMAVRTPPSLLHAHRVVYVCAEYDLHMRMYVPRFDSTLVGEYRTSADIASVPADACRSAAIHPPLSHTIFPPLRHAYGNSNPRSTSLSSHAVDVRHASGGWSESTARIKCVPGDEWYVVNYHRTHTIDTDLTSHNSCQDASHTATMCAARDAVRIRVGRYIQIDA